MNVPWRFLAVVLAVVAGSLLLAACGNGEEEVDVDEYFQRLDEIEGGIKTGIGALRKESEGPIGEDVEATRAYVDGYQDVIGQALNDMKELQPPAEAGDAHDEFVGALSNMLPLWEDLGERLADVESPSEVQEVLVASGAEPPWQTTAQRFTNACRELQGIADEKGIDVDLDCQ
jgi:hypothetical protein